jgi:hypothetical protein
MQETIPKRQSEMFMTSSGEVCSIYHYMIKFVSDLRHVGGFLWVLRFPPLINVTLMKQPDVEDC